MNCVKCDSRIIYVGKTQCQNLIILPDGLYFDDDVLDQTFYWICSGCGRKYQNCRENFEVRELLIRK